MFNLFTVSRQIETIKDALNTTMQQMQSLGFKMQNSINKGDELSRSYQALLTEFNAHTRQQHNFNLSVKKELETLRALISTPTAQTVSTTSSDATPNVEEITSVVPELTKTVRKVRTRKVAVEEPIVAPVKKTRAKKSGS